MSDTKIKDDGGYAFPQSVGEILGRATHSGEFGVGGMSLRDWFAGQAIAGFAAHDKNATENYAIQAYALADAMLAERAK